MKKLIEGYPYIPFTREVFEPVPMLERSRAFYAWMDQRRSVRDFSDRPVAREVMEQLVLTASTAPSGAHKQPWTFCVVGDPSIKKQIREAAEKEEYESYTNRMSDDWLEDLKPLGTGWHKPFLETAPWLIIVFKKSYDLQEDGRKRNTYYAVESCGLACGFLLAAIHQAGLVTLTHTPSPMNFLSKILNRPENEKPFLLLPTGYPAEDCWVPDIHRKGLEEMAVFY